MWPVALDCLDNAVLIDVVEIIQLVDVIDTADSIAVNYFDGSIGSV